MDFDELNSELELDPFEKILIIGAATSIVATTLIITSCFVIPGCHGYNYLKRRRKDSSSDKITMLDLSKHRLSIKLNEKISPLYQSVGSQLQIIEAQENYSQSQPSLFNGQFLPTTFLPRDVIKSPTILKIQLKYSAEQDVTSLGRLSVEIIDVENVPARCYPTLPDTRVVLQITHKRWTLSRQETLVHDVSTRTVRAANSPIFEQSFTFAASLNDLKGWWLKVSVFDDDRLTRCRETCAGRLNLRDLKGLMDKEICILTMKMEPSTTDRGQLLVALNYLPTSQRLTVNVMKTLKLAWQELVPALNLFRPYLRITLLDHAGKIIKKRKISGQDGTESPTFNGSASFQISPMVYETASIIIQVLSGIESEKAEDEDKKKSNILGFVALGWLVQEDAGRNHWRSILQSPRKTISQWYILH